MINLARGTFALWAVIPLTITGCSGDDYAAVTGVVTLRGAPVVGATVVFTPEPAGEGTASATAITDSNGTFRLQTNLPGGVTKNGAAPGTYKVTVSKFVPPGGLSEEEYAKKVEAEQALNKPYSATSAVLPKVELIPKEYSNVMSTKVDATVVSGANEVKIVIP